MLIKAMMVIKVLWVGAAVSVLLTTLYFYEGKDFSDIWVFLTWLMLILSFPAGAVVSLVHLAIGEVFAMTVKTSYLSLAFEWSAYLVLGYLQWFKLVPYVVAALQRYIRQKNSHEPIA